MGIQASYWLTGGIMTVLGLALGKLLLGLLGGLALTVGGLLLTVGAFLFKAMLLLLAVWLVVRLARKRGAAGA